MSIFPHRHFREQHTGSALFSLVFLITLILAFCSLSD